MPRSEVCRSAARGRQTATDRTERGAEHPCTENKSDSITFSGTISLKRQQTSSERSELAGELKTSDFTIMR